MFNRKPHGYGLRTLPRTHSHWGGTALYSTGTRGTGLSSLDGSFWTLFTFILAN